MIGTGLSSASVDILAHILSENKRDRWNTEDSGGYEVTKATLKSSKQNLLTECLSRYLI
jgi:hypothetical protein